MAHGRGRHKALSDRILHVAERGARRGEPFPGESTLAEMFQVSRPALREALAKLEGAGMIYRHQGAGTLLNEAALELCGRFDQFGEFSDVIAASGKEAKMELIECSVQPWNAREHGAFKNPPEQVLRAVKCWTADGTPARATIDIVPLPVGTRSDSVDAAVSVLKIVKKLTGDSVQWEIAFPTAVTADDDTSRWLAVRKGSPLLMLRTIGITASGDEAFRSFDYHVPGLIPQGLIRVVARPPRQ